MLNAEELVLRVDASIGAVWKLSNELEARDERLVVLGDFVGEQTLVVRSGERKDALVLGRGSTCVVKGGLAVASDGDLAEVVAVMQASRASVAGELR